MKVYVLKLKDDPRSYIFSTMELAKSACHHYATVMMPEGFMVYETEYSYAVGKSSIAPGEKWEALVEQADVDNMLRFLQEVDLLKRVQSLDDKHS